MLTKEQRDEIRAQTLRVIERDGGYTNGTGDTLALLDDFDEMERGRAADLEAFDRTVAVERDCVARLAGALSLTEMLARGTPAHRGIAEHVAKALTAIPPPPDVQVALARTERERDEAHRYLLQLLDADAHARGDVTRYLRACGILP